MHTQFFRAENLKNLKYEIRKIAEKQGFFNANKPDIQDICFVSDGNYSAFIEQYSGKKYPVGNFIDRNGTVLGQHKGIIHYTIGQRKGLGISASNPLYVCGIDILDNAVILGESRELFSCDLNAVDFNWIAFDTPPEKFCAKAKIRYHHVEQWAEINVIGEKMCISVLTNHRGQLPKDKLLYCMMAKLFLVVE